MRIDVTNAAGEVETHPLERWCTARALFQIDLANAVHGLEELRPHVPSWDGQLRLQAARAEQLQVVVRALSALIDCWQRHGPFQPSDSAVSPAIAKEDT